MDDARAPSSFWGRVEKTDTCWLWTGAIQKPGYGRYSFEGRLWLAHRWAYETFVGPIPEGLTIDHLCGVKNCVRPDHLEAVTSRENTLRSPNTMASRHAAKTHCPRNHPYDEANTLVSGGARYCRKCMADRKRRR